MVGLIDHCQIRHQHNITRARLQLGNLHGDLQKMFLLQFTRKEYPILTGS